MDRTPNCLLKLDRINKTLRHEEADRVPISDFYWGSFLERWRTEMGLPADADIYKHYDLDWLVTVPNMDPHIKPFEVISQSDSEITVRTGFEAVLRKKFEDPMPAFLHFETDTPEKMAAFEFDDPWDDRRWFAAGDNQLGGVGDGFTFNSPAWIETVKEKHPDIPVYGSACEAHEMLWRIIGSENVMLWIGLYPDEIGRFIDRLGEWCVELTKAQVKAAMAADGRPLIDGMVIWGDVAYRKDVFFSPKYWRRYFKPVVTEMTKVCHDAGIPVIYHGCGNVNRIFEDYIETKVDAYNPLEAKANLDVVDLRRRYGHRIGFCGNLDVLTWAYGTMDELKDMVLTKLNAAKGGGYIVQSDHSVPSNVSAERYEFVVNLVRQYGCYPLQLGQWDLPDIH